MGLDGGNGLFQLFFNGGQLLQLADVAEGEGNARLSGSAGAADAVDVGLRHIGQVVVHHAGQTFNVQAPGCNVRCHQHPELAGFEVGQGGLTGGLGLVSVDSGGGNARLFQISCHPVGPVFGAGKNQNGGVVMLPQQPGQKLDLLTLVRAVQALVNGVHGGVHRVHSNADRVVEQLVYQFLHLVGHGGGEKQGLFFLRQPLEDLLHIMDKAHVQHPVRLVQHKDLQLSQVNIPLLIEVGQSSGGGDQNICALLQGLYLGILAHAAEDDGAAQREIGAVGGKALLILERQLPGGGEYQRPDGMALPGILV